MILLTRNINIWVATGVVVVAIMLAMLGVQVANAQPSSVSIQATAAATTSVQYLTTATTYTYQIDNAVFSSGKTANTMGVDSLAVYIQVAASSTASVFSVQEQVSNNNVDWYVVNTGTALAVATSTYTFTPQTTATSSVALNLPYVPAVHTRLVFGVSGAAGAIYGEVDLKRNPNTP